MSSRHLHLSKILMRRVSIDITVWRNIAAASSKPKTRICPSTIITMLLKKLGPVIIDAYALGFGNASDVGSKSRREKPFSLKEQ
jgi:hypothetical protein